MLRRSAFSMSLSSLWKSALSLCHVLWLMVPLGVEDRPLRRSRVVGSTSEFVAPCSPSESNTSQLCRDTQVISEQGWLWLRHSRGRRGSCWKKTAQESQVNRLCFCAIERVLSLHIIFQFASSRHSLHPTVSTLSSLFFVLTVIHYPSLSLLVHSLIHSCGCL